MVAAGGYVLGAASSEAGLMGPFRALSREPGVRAMLWVAFLYSFTSSLGKVAITHSSPIFFSVIFYASLCAFLSPFVLYRARNSIASFVQAGMPRRLVLPGFLYAVMVAAHMTAMSMTKVAYMISVKRTSILMGVLYGYFMFREKDVRSRFAGAALMLAGFVVIVLSD